MHNFSFLLPFFSLSFFFPLIKVTKTLVTPSIPRNRGNGIPFQQVQPFFFENEVLKFFFHSKTLENTSPLVTQRDSRAFAQLHPAASVKYLLAIHVGRRWIVEGFSFVSSAGHFTPGKTRETIFPSPFSRSKLFVVEVRRWSGRAVSNRTGNNY